MVSLHAAVRYWSRVDAARCAMIYGDERINYGELKARVELAAGMLRSKGVAAGDVVALLMKNSAAFVELALATSHLGAVLLPINYRLGTEEVAYILGHAQARLLLVDEEFSVQSGGFPAVIRLDASAQADSRRLGQDIEPVHVDTALTPDKLFRLMYTSGTTDRPKGVMHSYQNYHWKCLDHITALSLGRDEKLLVVGPLYHVGAFDLPGMAVLMTGGMLAVMRDFNEHDVLSLIAREGLTGAWLAPVMLSRLLSYAQRGAHNLTSIRWVIGGGERTPEQRIKDFGSMFTQGRYVDAYGLTETCSGDTMMDPGRELEKIGSTGRALPHVSLEIRSDAGEVLPAGEEGEICLRGPKVTSGYWRDEQKTRDSFHGDWFRTGDIGYLDTDGYLFLTDRKKDMIISGGENIASSEVERVLYQMPQVAEVAAIGLPDERWGECVAAVVVLKPGQSLDLTQLLAFCAGHLGGFKIPKKLFIQTELPRNASGKVLKRELRDLLGAPTTSPHFRSLK
ncbi:MAG: AMP-binding protein [Burkholderiaceae bacterium]|nr:AMP-binding protein [Burkholderiaceae bacterium]